MEKLNIEPGHRSDAITNEFSGRHHHDPQRQEQQESLEAGDLGKRCLKVVHSHGEPITSIEIPSPPHQKQKSSYDVITSDQQKLEAAQRALQENSNHLLRQLQHIMQQNDALHKQLLDLQDGNYHLQVQSFSAHRVQCVEWVI
jgi:hypothetical protein